MSYGPNEKTDLVSSFEKHKSRASVIKFIRFFLVLAVGILIGSILTIQNKPTANPSRTVIDSNESQSRPQQVLEERVHEINQRFEKSGLSVEWFESLKDLDAYSQLGVLHEKLQRFEDEQAFPELMDSLGLFEGNSINWLTRIVIASRWATVNPRAMLDYISENPKPSDWSLRDTLFSVWMRNDPRGAYRAALEIEGSRARYGALSAVFSVLLETEPERAVEMAEAHYDVGVGRSGFTGYKNLFKNWAIRDLDAAAAYALALNDHRVKTVALSGLVEGWIDGDPLSALTWLDSLPEDPSVSLTRSRVFSSMRNLDFHIVKRYLDTVEDPILRREIIESMPLSNLSKDKPYEAIEELYEWLKREADGNRREGQLRTMIGELTKSNPDKAARYFLDMDRGEMRDIALREMASALSLSDREAAINFVTSLKNDEDKKVALGGISLNLWRPEVEPMARLIRNSKDPLLQRSFAATISREWSKYDAVSAISWAEELDDKEARANAIRSALPNWIEVDPARVVRYIDEEIIPEERIDRLKNTYGIWAGRDPESAANALKLLPLSAETESDAIYRRVARAYVAHDPVLASEWISTLEHGTKRDQSVELLVGEISRTDPEAGFLWAATVDDDNRRIRVLRSSVREWAKSDPRAAYNAIVSARIDEAEKKPLLMMIATSTD